MILRDRLVRVAKGQSQQRIPDKTYGWQFGLVLLVIGLFAYARGWPGVITASLILLSTLHFVAALLKPVILAPFNIAISALGLFLGRVMSPIFLGILFFLLITPLGLVLKSFGRDTLKLRTSSEASYWRQRDLGIVKMADFKNQF